MNLNAAATYRRNAILTASPGKLVKMLYEGAITNLERTRVSLSDAKTRRSAETGETLGRAYGIIGELRAALNFEVGGEIARNLDLLYEFSLDQLTSANSTREPAHVDNTLRVMRTLKEGWDAVLAN
ncbi:MAG: flagellar export chaperone FliS [Planctomycetota bacterium]